VTKIDHRMIREFMDTCMNSGCRRARSPEAGGAAVILQVLRQRRTLKDNPARLVPTPKLPKRIPVVLSAEEMSGFLDQLAGAKYSEAGRKSRKARRKAGTTAPEMGIVKFEDSLLLRRDRALLELLYAAGLRVSELTGLNLADMDQKEQMLRVRGKGNKERIVPYDRRRQKP